MTSSSTELKKTPLHAFHQRHGARFTDFGGWDMPVQYGGILEEHRAVRTAAGLFDVSHMGECDVRGAGAADFLNHLLTNDVSRLQTGRALYSPMCYENGGTVDDLIVWKRDEGDYLLCINAANTAKDMEWIHRAATGFEVSVEDVSDRWALLALQGPQAAEILLGAADGGVVDGLKPFAFAEAVVAGIPCLVSRTGYTGEEGFEIFCGPGQAEELAEVLLATSQSRGLVPAGLGARDTLRLEAGFPLYGHELSADISPIQAGLGWTVKFGKPDFIGRPALLAQKESGPANRVVHFRTGGRRIIRPGTEVFSGTEKAGEVLSGTISPSLNEAIGTALVAAGAGALAAEVRGHRIDLQVVKPPFHRGQSIAKNQNNP